MDYRKGSFRVVKVLINNGAHINHMLIEGLRLIDNGANVNANDNDNYGRTPLHRASEKGHVDVAEVLIDNGADTSTPRTMMDGRCCTMLVSTMVMSTLPRS